MMGGFANRQTDPGYNKKIGTVKADGSFSLQLPAKVVTGKNGIVNNRWLSCGYFGDKGKIDYSNTKYRGYGWVHSVSEINDKLIGRLYHGDSLLSS